ncbi:unnamed protein product [Mucor hiemalis]
MSNVNRTPQEIQKNRLKWSDFSDVQTNKETVNVSPYNEQSFSDSTSESNTKSLDSNLAMSSTDSNTSTHNIITARKGYTLIKRCTPPPKTPTVTSQKNDSGFKVPAIPLHRKAAQASSTAHKIDDDGFKVPEPIRKTDDNNFKVPKAPARKFPPSPRYNRVATVRVFDPFEEETVEEEDDDFSLDDDDFSVLASPNSTEDKAPIDLDALPKAKNYGSNNYGSELFRPPPPKNQFHMPPTVNNEIDSQIHHAHNAGTTTVSDNDQESPSVVQDNKSNPIKDTKMQDISYIPFAADIPTKAVNTSRITPTAGSKKYVPTSPKPKASSSNSKQLTTSSGKEVGNTSEEPSTSLYQTLMGLESKLQSEQPTGLSSSLTFDNHPSSNLASTEVQPLEVTPIELSPSHTICLPDSSGDGAFDNSALAPESVTDFSNSKSDQNATKASASSTIQLPQRNRRVPKRFRDEEDDIVETPNVKLATRKKLVKKNEPKSKPATNRMTRSRARGVGTANVMDNSDVTPVAGVATVIGDGACLGGLMSPML